MMDEKAHPLHIQKMAKMKPHPWEWPRQDIINYKRR